jgi:zinc protease
MRGREWFVGVVGLWLWSIACVVAACVVAGCAGRLPAPPAPPERWSQLALPIHAFRIEGNGLRVVLLRDPKASQVQVAMHYRVGMIDEPAGREGIAHLAEHVMFEPVVGPGDETLSSKLEATAAWFNAVTAPETTAYVSRADPGRLAELLQLEAQRLGIGCKTLTEEAFVRQRAVVVNELRERAADRRTKRAVLEALYPADHPYLRALPSGEEERVARLSREDVCAFIDAHYSPDNAVLIVSGDVTPEALDEALGKLLGRIAKRPIVARPAVAPFARRAQARITVPVDEPGAVVAWPLPDEPAERARVRAVAAMMALHINTLVKGDVHVAELGVAGASSILFVISPGPDEPLPDALDAVGRAAIGMHESLRADAFERALARAGYGLFAQLEDSHARDALLAEHVLAGRDPGRGLAAEIEVLNSLSADSAREIVKEDFSFAKATIVLAYPEAPRRPGGLARPAAAPQRLAGAPATQAGAPGAQAGAAKAGAAKPGHLAGAASLEPQVHRRDEPRVRADPAAARAAAPRTLDRDPLAGVRERTLANGLRVILMPLTSVPTVDVRIVFGAGRIDEPERQHGAALLAAHALALRLADVAALREISNVGGAYDADVGIEHTTFAASGLDMYVDVLLTGLARVVRRGSYVERDHRDVLRRIVAQLGAEDTLADVWRTALYGAAHPYARAEDWRGARFDKLDRDALDRFRATHFRPGSATLIVAGGFDPAIAERWIDYLFAGWRGAPAPARTFDRARLEPVALAKHDARARQVAIEIALPAPGRGRAASLVATRMIEAAIADVRAQLGASYGLHARLVEERLASHIEISGSVAAERAEEALALVRARLGRLAAGDDVAASWFVAARRGVIAQLSSIEPGASSLASLAEAAVRLGRPLNANLAAAEEARRLTLEQMAPALGGIELARAAILMSGPPDAVTRAFAALGRTPRVLAR